MKKIILTIVSLFIGYAHAGDNLYNICRSYSGKRYPTQYLQNKTITKSNISGIWNPDKKGINNALNIQIDNGRWYSLVLSGEVKQIISYVTLAIESKRKVDVCTDRGYLLGIEIS